MKRWFKKRFYLPIKYWFVRRRIIKNGRIRSPEELIRLRWELQNDLLVAERNNFENGKTIINAKIQVLNWLLYDSTENQSYYKDGNGRVG